MHLIEHSIKMRHTVHTMFGVGLLDVSTADGGTWVIGDGLAICKEMSV